MDPKTFYVGVKGVICIDNKCLLLKRQKADETYWDFPGGKISGSETIEEALRREISEELPSLTTYTIGGLIEATRLHKDLKDGNALLLLAYQITAEPFEVELSEEHVGYRWVAKDDIPELLADTSIRLTPHDTVLRQVLK